MTPFPLNFEPKASTPNRKDARFTFHTRRAVQSAIADLLAIISNYNSYPDWRMSPHADRRNLSRSSNVKYDGVNRKPVGPMCKCSHGPTSYLSTYSRYFESKDCDLDV